MPGSAGENEMLFRILHNDETGELTYLLAELKTREAILIDPRGRDRHVLAALLNEGNLRLRWILRTHHHDKVQSSEINELALLGAPIVQGDAADRTQLANDGETVPFGKESMHVLATPGHTMSCLSYSWRDRVFCGGLLTTEACPLQPYALAPDLLWESVTQRLFTLPGETLLFSGHVSNANAVSTVFERRRWHPLFARLTRDEFIAQMARRLESKMGMGSNG
jgi:glyoxylase-like metal-dependent hydrolase (beta-lactamase superfamily II)